MTAAVAVLLACSHGPTPAPAADKSADDVEILFRQMVDRRSLSVKDPLYQKIIGKGIAISPDLKRIAKNRDIQWHFIAYFMLGQIKDRESIPFLFEALETGNEAEQVHAVRGLNCLLRLGLYNQGDGREAQVQKRYRQWWADHRDEFGPVAAAGPAS